MDNDTKLKNDLQEALEPNYHIAVVKYIDNDDQVLERTVRSFPTYPAAFEHFKKLADKNIACYIYNNGEMLAYSCEYLKEYDKIKP